MIKFFHNIRKTNLTEGKMANYIKYAIGEIVLVVVGILIALQVNNWNEHQKQKKKETVYLQNLSIDLKKQIHLLNFYIDFEDIILKDCKDIIAHYEQNSGFKKMDSIFPKINDLSARVTFTNTNTTLLELLNSGEINVIENETLKKELMEFNQLLERFASNTVHNNTNLVDQIVVRSVMKNSNFAYSSYSNKMKSMLQENFTMSFITVKDNNLKTIAIQNLNEPTLKLEFINNIVFRYGLAELQKGGDENLKSKAAKLLKQIVSELSQ